MPVHCLEFRNELFDEWQHPQVFALEVKPRQFIVVKQKLLVLSARVLYQPPQNGDKLLLQANLSVKVINFTEDFVCADNIYSLSCFYVPESPHGLHELELSHIWAQSQSSANRVRHLDVRASCPCFIEDHKGLMFGYSCPSLYVSLGPEIVDSPLTFLVREGNSLEIRLALQQQLTYQWNNVIFYALADKTSSSINDASHSFTYNSFDQFSPHGLAWLYLLGQLDDRFSLTQH